MIRQNMALMFWKIDFFSRTCVEIILQTKLMPGKGQYDPVVLTQFSGWDIVTQHHLNLILWKFFPKYSNTIF